MRRLLLLSVVLLAPACSGGATALAGTATYAGHAASCPRPHSYVPRLSAASGKPGARVTLSGTLPLYDETGKLDLNDPSTRFQVWWNLDFAKWWSAFGTHPHPKPARPGSVTRLLTAAIPVPNPCTYRLSVTIPRAGPGAYGLTVIYMGGGAASLNPVAFRITG